MDHPLISAWREDAPWLQGHLIITPHTALYSEKSLYDMRYMAAETVSMFLNQNEFRNRIV
jgi:D-3-phosphoglycerate dehydrogenase/C-terminal binding protein